MCKENTYTKMEKLEAHICRCPRHGLKVMPCQACNTQTLTPFMEESSFGNKVMIVKITVHL